jgi:hypothetical protein
METAIFTTTTPTTQKHRQIVELGAVDAEWAKFISPDYNNSSSDEDDDGDKNTTDTNLDNTNNTNNTTIHNAPKASDIYISTKSKIAYLDSEIDLKNIFWKVPVISYATPTNGVIKKQMKFNSFVPEDLATIKEHLKSETCFDEQIITSIDNPNGRIKFKDIRKVSIGISKKDIMSYRCKRKSAFYNCFVMILRIKILGQFKEFHIKVFNTGKLEIPGIQTDHIFEQVLLNIIQIIQPHVDFPLGYKQTSDTVLINSNFNSGFFINRELLFDILKFKYNIQCIYDPCSYPGIQCKFYYNKELSVAEQTGSQISAENKSLYKNIVTVSFMIFRTGSILIVGMCDENVLYSIYEFLKVLLAKEFSTVGQQIITPENTVSKDKKKKIRKKIIIVDIVTSQLHL